MPSEVAQTKEYEPTYPLLYLLAQLQSLIDMETEELVQTMGGACDTAGCELGEWCEKCVNVMA